MAPDAPPSYAPAPLRVTVSVRRERLPRPGPTRASWQWDDVLATPPPPARRAPREGTFIVRHGFDEDPPDPESRVGYATVVTCDPREGAAVPVHVQERVTAESRVLAPVLVVERAVQKRMAQGRSVGRRLVTQGSTALSERVGGRGGALITRSTHATLGVGSWVSRTLSDAVHAIVVAPDRLWAGASSAEAQLARRRDRRTFLKGLWNPHALSTEGKAAALVVVSAVLAFALLAGTLFVALAHPTVAPAWRALLGYFLLGIGSTLLFPAFPELRLQDVAATVAAHSDAGIGAAILTISVAMTLGGWMVLFLGDAVHGAVKRSVRGDSPLARGLARAEGLARRYGFWFASIGLAVPMGPDTLIFYLLATARTPVKQYLAGAFLGLLVRFTLFHTVAARFYVL